MSQGISAAAGDYTADNCPQSQNICIFAPKLLIRIDKMKTKLNIALATNRTTADMILTSTLLQDPSYEIGVPDCIAGYANRKL